MLMEYLEHDLTSLLKTENNNLSSTIAISLLNCIKELHQAGFIHQDIKPENFRVKNNEIKIIDFGISKQYIRNDIHIAEGRVSNFIGTYNYGSMNAHRNLTLSRRDDLESLGYTFLHFILDKSLPW